MSQAVFHVHTNIFTVNLEKKTFTGLLRPLEIMSCVHSVESGAFNRSVFLTEMLPTLQSLYPKDEFLKDSVQKKPQLYQRDARNA